MEPAARITLIAILYIAEEETYHSVLRHLPATGIHKEDRSPHLTTKAYMAPGPFQSSIQLAISEEVAVAAHGCRVTLTEAPLQEEEAVVDREEWASSKTHLLATAMSPITLLPFVRGKQ